MLLLVLLLLLLVGESLLLLLVLLLLDLLAPASLLFFLTWLQVAGCSDTQAVSAAAEADGCVIDEVTEEGSMAVCSWVLRRSWQHAVAVAAKAIDVWDAWRCRGVRW